MKIYFEDGELRPSGVFVYRIDATHGVRHNLIRLDVMLTDEPDAIVYTNQILAFSNKYAWNEELKAPEIYIRAGKYQVFTRIDKLTERELRQAHNLAHMYVAGEFDKRLEENT